MKFLIPILIVAYVFFNIYVSKRIDKAIYLKEERRKLHKQFIWMLPFLGALIIRDFWKKVKCTKTEVMTKSKREYDRSTFYESGTGIYGG